MALRGDRELLGGIEHILVLKAQVLGQLVNPDFAAAGHSVLQRVGATGATGPPHTVRPTFILPQSLQMRWRAGAAPMPRRWNLQPGSAGPAADAYVVSPLLDTPGWGRDRPNGPCPDPTRVPLRPAELPAKAAGDPAARASACVKATTFFDDAKVVADASRGLGEAMVGINVADLPAPHRLAERGW